jgi:tetratricopeptide (TPR) repeat protein/Zn-dependent protease with chaperone function
MSADRLTTRHEGVRPGELAFALLGYAYILGVIAATVVVITLAIKWQPGAARLFVYTGIGLTFLLLRTLLVGLERPEGVPLSKADAPGLFELVDRVREVLGTPQIHHVLLAPDLNAAVLERRRWGIIGPWERTLLLGLPLLDGFDRRGVESVIAHECGHLAMRHGRSRLWFARLHATWTMIVVSLETSRHWSAPIFRYFFRWYVPKLTVMSQAVARRNEFEADAAEARVTDAATAGFVLLRLGVLNLELARVFWPGIHRESSRRPEPPDDAFERMRAFLHPATGHVPTRAAIEETVNLRTLDDDSHPSVAERLKAWHIDLPPGSAGNEFADRLLARHRHGDSALGLLATPEHARSQVAVQWVQSIRPAWRHWHADARLAASGSRDIVAVTVAAARWAGACLPPVEALPLAQAALEMRSDDLSLQTLVGRLSLDVGGEETDEGIELLESVAEVESREAVLAGKRLEMHYASLGRWDLAVAIRDRATAVHFAFLRHLGEQATLAARDTLAPEPLAHETLGELGAALAGMPEVEEGFLVRKVTTRFREDRIVALILVVKLNRLRFEEWTYTRVIKAFQENVSVAGSADWAVMATHRRSKLARRLRRIPEARCYHAGRPVGSRVVSPVPHRAPWWAKVSAGGAYVGVLLALMTVVFAWNLFLESRPPASLDELRARAAAASEDLDAQRDLAYRLTSEEHFGEALPVLRRAVALDSADGWVRNHLAWTLGRLDSFALALPEIERALDLTPNRAYVHHNAGWILANLKRFEEAIPHYRKAIALAPDHPGAHYEFANALAESSLPSEALVEAREAARIAPTEAMYHHEVGRLAAWLGRHHEALYALRRSAELAPESPEPLGLLAREAYITNHPVEAARALHKLAGLDRQRIERIPELAQLWADLERSGEIGKVLPGTPVVDSRRPLTLSDSLRAADDSFEARFSGQRERALAVAAEVTRVRVRRSSLTLAVGDTVSFKALGIEALDSAGARLATWVPALQFEGGSSVRFNDEGRIEAVEPGTTRLIVAADPMALRGVNARRRATIVFTVLP